VIVQCALAGVIMPTAVALLWEMLGRGVAPSRRGTTLSLAFGLGPVLAVLGSVASVLPLQGRFGPLEWPALKLEYPVNFAVQYGTAAGLMALGALFCSRCVVRLPEREVEREPFVQGVFGGVRDILTNRVLLTATVVIILVYIGNTISTNMNLYSPQVLGAPAEQYIGLQLTYRFGFKVVAGLLLGWVLTRTNPKTGLLTTA